MTLTDSGLSFGKRYGLQRCADSRGVYAMLALDHRQSLRDAFKVYSNPFGQAIEFKRQVVQAVAPHATAVLLDPALGVGPAIAQASLPRGIGLIMTVEESGYEGERTARMSRLAEGWSVSRSKRIGAAAIKLLVYYHPESRMAAAMRDFVTRTADECRRLDLPLFLEALTYSVDPNRSKLNSAERRAAVVETAKQLSPLGADVLKAEFPVTAEEEPDEKVWLQACIELTRASSIPWVLLSAAVDYDLFLKQSEIACRGGASGILAGRAIWKEALGMDGAARSEFLETVAAGRMQELRRACEASACPHAEAVAPRAIDREWYRSYGDF